jgi:hypothetical protein
LDRQLHRQSSRCMLDKKRQQDTTTTAIYGEV